MENTPKPLEPLIYELSVAGRVGANLPACDVPETPLPADLLRAELDLPEVSELDVVRHYTRLSALNMAIDKTFYPLGSCTMKYNPRVNEDMARLPGFAHLHPLSDEHHSQGALALMYHLQEWLREIVGFTAISLQPGAGAQGEFAGILMIRAYHKARGDEKRTKIIVPTSAHGTNPATTTMAGLEVVEVPADANGMIDLAAVKAVCDETIAGMMTTVPSTLGVFDENILEVIEAVHACGGLMYMDGANMNALLGAVKPGELGFDVMHYNLHKTSARPMAAEGQVAGQWPVMTSSPPSCPALSWPLRKRLVARTMPPSMAGTPQSKASDA
jgi:glycine dehydrogenase subunit 2